MLPLHRSTSRCFVYGTLMSRDVLRTLLGRVPQMDPRLAFLPPHYRRYPVRNHVFPGVIPNPETPSTKMQSERVQGILLSGITPEELEIFDWFEDVAYERCTVGVSLEPIGESESEPMETIDADVYVWTAGDELLDLESSWSFEDFCAQKLPWYLRTTVRPCRDEYDKQRR